MGYIIIRYCTSLRASISNKPLFSFHHSWETCGYWTADLWRKDYLSLSKLCGHWNCRNPYVASLIAQLNSSHIEEPDLYSIHRNLDCFSDLLHSNAFVSNVFRSTFFLLQTVCECIETIILDWTQEGRSCIHQLRSRWVVQVVWIGTMHGSSKCRIVKLASPHEHILNGNYSPRVMHLSKGYIPIHTERPEVSIRTQSWEVQLRLAPDFSNAWRLPSW